MRRALSGFLLAVLVVIGAAYGAFRFKTGSLVEPGVAAWAGDSMRFVAWNDERWTAWIHDGRFELVPENKRRWSRYANASIPFIDWDGEPWQAKIEGETFLLARNGDWQGPVETSDAIRYRDWSGNNQLRTVRELER